MFRLAVVGLGRIGRVHARNVGLHPALELAGAVDPLAEPAIFEALRTAPLSFEDTLSDASIHALVIASPTHAHLDQTLRALDAGKWVLCEKPLDLDLSRARAAAASIAPHAQRLTLGFNRRFDPHFSALHARLAAGEIGALESLQITSHDPAPPSPDYVRTSGGLFKDMAIHDFDMARWLLGEEPVEVFAAASCLIDPSIGAAGDIDTAKTLLKTASGRLCVISNSRRSGYGYDQRVEAFGARGALRVGNLPESQVSSWSETGPRDDRFTNFFLDRYADAYRRELDQFAEMMAGRSGPAIGYGDAVAALSLAEAAQRSLVEARPVRPT